MENLFQDSPQFQVDEDFEVRKPDHADTNPLKRKVGTTTGMSNNNNSYNRSDTGPYIVFITTDDKNENEPKRSNLGDIHPMQIERKLRDKDNRIKWIKIKGKDLLQATYDDHEAANDLVKNQAKLLGPLIWRAYIPDFKVQK